ELFIRKFAKVYTPIVVLLAVLITTIPALLVRDYVFADRLYRSWVFLVLSCPCALVISIPLGYFGGIGAASRHGILIKGSNFLDVLANIQQVVMDKTGTLTKGSFSVQNVYIADGFNRVDVLAWANALEQNSTHPVATAIREYVGPIDQTLRLESIEEIAGYGLCANLEGKELLVGNFKLLNRFGIEIDVTMDHVTNTVVAIGYDGRFAGYLTIADEIKPDATQTIQALKNLGITTTMLSGDRTALVKQVAQKIGVSAAYGDLLPEDKANKIKEMKSTPYRVAFVGDGV